MPASPFEHMSTQIAFHIVRPDSNLAGARAAAAKLEDRLVPAILDHFAEPPRKPHFQLLQPPASPACHAWSSALFRQTPELGVADIPPEWVPAYVSWTGRLKRSRDLARFVEAREQGEAILTEDPISAGLLLFMISPEPGSPLREHILETALKHPLGAYLAAEALHTPDERESIFKALADDSLARLGASRLHDFATACLRRARAEHDLASGLVVARLGSDEDLAGWLRQAGLAAFAHSGAASAMLVLNPEAPERLRECWLAILGNSNAGADGFATVRWARHTWPPAEWTGLMTSLEAVATADGGPRWFHWFSQFQPEIASARLGMPADPLWAFELVCALNLDDQPLRFRLADELGRRTHHPASSLILEALNDRPQIRQSQQQGGR